jgi:hypothetical protein
MGSVGMQESKKREESATTRNNFLSISKTYKVRIAISTKALERKNESIRNKK